MKRSVTLVGLGRIGLTNDPWDSERVAILTHARAIAQSSDFLMEAGLDPDEDARAEFSQRYEAPAFASLSDLPPEFGRDVVVIACPTEHHAPIVRELLERSSSPRAIMVEKPMGASAADAVGIVAACRTSGTHLFVNYHRAVLPSTATIRELITTEAIRAPYSGQALISGERLTNGSHMVDLLIDWLGPVVSTALDPIGGGLWLEFVGSRVLLSQLEPDTFSIFEVTLLARNGRLRFDGWNDRWWWEGMEADLLTAGYECLSEPSPVVPDGVSTFMASVYADLARALGGQPSTLRRGDRAIAVHEALNGWV